MKSDPDKFLALIRSAHRGRHKIYLGYCAGVGKTYKMLQEAHRLRDVEHIDVAIGLLETHNRAETVACKGDLEEIPRRKTEYHGIELTEMDVDAAVARHPQVLLVDELAHTNVPGSKNQKRYQDVEDLLEAGINVISTLNVQHLESLYEIIEKTTGIRVTERIPDWVVTRADEVINVDLSTADLRERIRTGRVYPKNQIDSALDHFFVDGNLQQLRELALRELASQLDRKFRSGGVEGNGTTKTSPDQLLVCLSSRFQEADRLLRYATRIAGPLNRNWYALHITTPGEAAKNPDVQKSIDHIMDIAASCGAKVFEFKSSDVAQTILQFAKEHRVGQVIIGSPNAPLSWKDRLLNRSSIVEQLSVGDRDFKLIIAEREQVAKKDDNGHLAE